MQAIRNARAAFIAANYPEGTREQRCRANAVLDALIRNSTDEEHRLGYEDPV